MKSYVILKGVNASRPNVVQLILGCFNCVRLHFLHEIRSLECTNRHISSICERHIILSVFNTDTAENGPCKSAQLKRRLLQGLLLSLLLLLTERKRFLRRCLGRTAGCSPSSNQFRSRPSQRKYSEQHNSEQHIFHSSTRSRC